MEFHNIPPVYDANSKVLILGSFPSVRSREEQFFYAHPQNRFWKVISYIFGETCPETISDKKAMLLRNGIALWDVIGCCNIQGSADSSITDVKANDISDILIVCPDIRMYVNGKTAEKYYNRYILPKTGRKAVVLPSTSAANAAYSFEELVQIWSQIIK